MALLFNPPENTPVSGSGTPYAGALRYFYSAGTTSPLTAYTDSTLAVPHPIPQVADANGLFAPAFFSESTSTLRYVLKTSAAVTLRDYDNIPTSAVSTAIVQQAVYPRSAAETAALITPTSRGSSRPTSGSSRTRS
jgi:hypothetical protein